MKREDFHEVDVANGEPLLPETVAASYGNDLGCILQDTFSINETMLRDPSRHHLQTLLIMKLHKRYRFPKDYNDETDLTTNLVNTKSLTKFTKALSSWKSRLREMICYGKDFSEVSMAYPQITEEEWTIFKETTAKPATQDMRNWGLQMRDKNLGTHYLGSRGYYCKRHKWRKEDANNARDGIPSPYEGYRNHREQEFIRAHYRHDKSGNLVTSKRMLDLQ
jgi:hypothetical protein